MIDRAEIKREAKGIMRQARVSPLLIGLLIFAITMALDKVQSLVEYGTLFPTWRLFEYASYLASADPAALLEMSQEELMATP